ncbi:hypothetical protein [Nocardiopsis sp. YSL2]|uniref:hypothetical protein n=1 Tax=Nocardiopsis sp. YSL2 TaxID=2939492 RepID=UPI0026F41E58|nr:hypothetical protein [Nocardiopsis sp. YSL2]
MRLDALCGLAVYATLAAHPHGSYAGSGLGFQLALAVVMAGLAAICLVMVLSGVRKPPVVPAGPSWFAVGYQAFVLVLGAVCLYGLLLRARAAHGT